MTNEQNVSIMAHEIYDLLRKTCGSHIEGSRSTIKIAITAYLWGREFVPRADLYVAQGIIQDLEQKIDDLQNEV